MKIQDKNRRSFVKFSVTTLFTLPILTTLNTALANDADKLSEDDPTAKALGYKEDTANVDFNSFPNHNDDQICKGCILYQGDDPDWGGCGAFPGKKVAGQGWCAAFAPKPA